MTNEEIKVFSQEFLLVFSVVTHKSYQIKWHHQLIAQKLEAVARGEIKRLIISMPPRHGKTELTTIRYPAWILGKNPDFNIISATYNQDFATDNSRKVRDLVMEPTYNSIFNVRLSKSAKAAGKWFTNEGGFYYSVGIGGGLTGRGANLLLIDDPHKDRQEAESDVKRQRVWDWYTSTAYTRLEKDAAVVIIMTRWHEDDLVGRLLKGEEDWEYICLPAISETETPQRKIGEALWPEKYNIEQLKIIRQTIGIRDWTSLYQQRPVPLEGNIFKIDDWEYYDNPIKPVAIFQSWDTAFKTGKQNDFSVCTTWAVTQEGYFLLHRYKDKAEFSELKNILIELANEFKPRAILIEDAASGQSIIQELKRTRLPIFPIRPDKDKISRAISVTSLIRAKKVFLPANKNWVKDFIESLAYFPNGKHDDDVDSFTQALNWIQDNFKLVDKSSKINYSLER